MKRLPIMSSLAYVPVDRVISLAKLRERLTITVTRSEFSQADTFDDPLADILPDNGGEAQTFTVCCYDDKRPGYIGLPRPFARATFPGLRYVQTFSAGTPQPELFPATIQPRDALQATFMNDLIRVNDQPGAVDAFVLAHTGTGKTVAALNLIQHDGIPTLVLVPSNRLKEQWLGNTNLGQGMRFFWGDTWVDRHTGIVQQDRCDFSGKLVVVALVHSIARRDYPTDLYRYFGRVIFDEIDMMATPGLVRSMNLFSARVRIGMTATRRRDNLQTAINFYFGAVQVSSSARTRRPTVYTHIYAQRDCRLDESSEGTLINSLVRLPQRNQRLLGLILRKYEDGRNIVVLGDRVNHLQSLRDRVVASGTPEQEVGLFVGKYWAGTFKVTISFQQLGKRRHTSPQTFARRREAQQYAQQWIECKRVDGVDIGDPRVKVYKHMYQPTEAEYNYMKEHCRIILATYQIFGRGLDAGHLDCGIEATPRGDIRQPLGRIGRSPTNPRPPEWHSITDMIVPPRESMFDPDPKPYAYFLDKAKVRLLSYRHHDARVVNVPPRDNNATGRAA